MKVKMNQFTNQKPSALEILTALHRFRETFEGEMLTAQERHEAFLAYVRLFRSQYESSVRALAKDSDGAGKK